MTHHAARQREARRLGHRRAVGRADRPQRPHRADLPSARHVSAGQHGDDAGQGARAASVSILSDARMGMRRAHQYAVQGARRPRYPPRSGLGRAAAGDPLCVAAARRCRPGASCLLQLLAHQIESLERRLVGHQEQVGIAVDRLMPGQGPVRNREHVVLRPVERSCRRWSSGQSPATTRQIML